MFCLETFILDGIINITLFDGVEGLNYNLSFLIMQKGLDKKDPYERHWCLGRPLLYWSILCTNRISHCHLFNHQQFNITIFDGVEGLNYNTSFLIMQEGLDKNDPYESHWCVGRPLLYWSILCTNGILHCYLFNHQQFNRKTRQ